MIFFLRCLLTPIWNSSLLSYMFEMYHFACVAVPCEHGFDNRIHAQGFNHIKYRLNWNKMNCFPIRTDFLQFPLLLILICTCNKLLCACNCVPKFCFWSHSTFSNICFSLHKISWQNCSCFWVNFFLQFLPPPTDFLYLFFFKLNVG